MSNTLPAHLASSLLAVTLALALTACYGRDAPASGAATVDAAMQAKATANRLARLDGERLRTLARRSTAAQRVHAPAGDNAVEYYLALRDRAPADAAISTALVEFQPYVLIAAEQALSRSQPDEAQRLLKLLERIDAQAPALPRLRDAVVQLREAMLEKATADREALLAKEADEKARAEAEKERASVERLARTASGSAPAEAARPAATSPAPVRDVAPARTEPAQLAAVVAVEPARSAPAPARESGPALPRLLQDEAPRYPLAAMNRKLEGQVEIAFTIEPDGRVSNPRVAAADPAGVFDRAALAAASRWRFEATGASASTSRTLTFRLPKG